jgi:DNA polymerase III subunit epsilon
MRPLRFAPSGEHSSLTQRINPRVPIPPAATAIHGISDADVAGQPIFAAVADELLNFLENCDLAGFGLRRFDLPFLHAEFQRAGRDLSIERRVILDVKEIYHQSEPRDLAAAVRRYCGREHVAAHAALVDAAATAEVLDACRTRSALLEPERH